MFRVTSICLGTSIFYLFMQIGMSVDVNYSMELIRIQFVWLPDTSTLYTIRRIVWAYLFIVDPIFPARAPSV